MIPFTHFNAKTVKEACALLEKHKGKAALNAGGTDLIGVMKSEIFTDYPGILINIKTIPRLEYIRETDKKLKIGALTRLSSILNSSILKKHCKVLIDATHSVATPQIRNAATIGGNLCQDVRCWYYRYPRQIGGPLECLRKGKGPCLAVKGDNRYHAIIGGKKCFAVCPSDIAVTLAAMNAKIVIAGMDTQRRILVTDLFTPTGTTLKRSEMVKGIEIPIKNGMRTRQKFFKFTLRKGVDFAIVSVASVLAVERGVCRDASIVLGAVAPGPVRAKAAEEKLIGRRITEEIANEAAEAALEGARPLSKNAYKIQIAKTLVKRAIMAGVNV